MAIVKSLQTRGQNTLQPCPQLGFPEGIQSRDRDSLFLPGAANSLLCIRVAALAVLWGLAAAPDALAGSANPMGAEL